MLAYFSILQIQAAVPCDMLIRRYQITELSTPLNISQAPQQNSPLCESSWNLNEDFRSGYSAVC